MGLNETLERLARERELRENPEVMEQARQCAVIRDYAEKIFFQRMLKDINHGLGEVKIDAMIDRSLMIATKLYNKLHQWPQTQ